MAMAAAITSTITALPSQSTVIDTITTTNLPMSYGRNVLGSLTTTWSRPTQCSVYGYQGPSNTVAFFQGQICSGISMADAAFCWPPATASTPAPPFNGWGFYSPGLYCPSGHTSACTAAKLANGSPSLIGSSSLFSFQFPLNPNETAIGCCPTGMSCDNEKGIQTCRSIMSDSTINPAGYCSENGPEYQETGALAVGISSAGKPNRAFAPMIEIVFQSSDLQLFISPATSQILSATPTGMSEETGLSPAAKIGIGLGVPFGVLLIAGTCAIVFLFCRRRARGVLQEPGELAGIPGVQVYKNGQPFQSSHPNQSPVEVDAAGASQNKYKARNGRYELDNASWQGIGELPS